MSIGSIMSSLFGNLPTGPQNVLPPQNTGMATPQTPTGVANPGQPLPGTVANTQTAPNGMIPDNAQVQADPSKPVSPLDGFSDIWQTPTNPDPNAYQPAFSALDPNKVMESARKVDFAKAITPDQLAKIQAGGPESLQAFAAAMNTVAQTVYAQSAMATTKIVENALSKQTENYNANLPAMVKRFSVNENLRTENPLLSNPAVQPLVGALAEQLTRKNPNASAAEIQTQVNDYFNALGTAFQPKPVETAESRRASRVTASQDWGKFLED